MNIKIIAAVLVLVALSIVLTLATANALMTPPNTNNSPTGNSQWWPFDDDGGEFREGGMMWEQYPAYGNGNTGYFEGNQGWHR